MNNLNELIQQIGVVLIRLVVYERISSAFEIVEIKASSDSIWKAVSDVTRVPEWSPECVKVEWENGPKENLVGSKFTGSNKRGWIRWRGYCEVVTAVPEKTFSYNVKPLRWLRPMSRWTWNITEKLEGRSIVKLSCEANYYTILGRVVFGTIEQRMVQVSKDIGVTLNRMKSSLENKNVT